MYLRQIKLYKPHATNTAAVPSTNTATIPATNTATIPATKPAPDSGKGDISVQRQTYKWLPIKAERDRNRRIFLLPILVY